MNITPYPLAEMRQQPDGRRGMSWAIRVGTSAGTPYRLASRGRHDDLHLDYLCVPCPPWWYAPWGETTGRIEQAKP